MPGSLNQPTAHAGKPTVVAFCSSGRQDLLVASSPGPPLTRIAGDGVPDPLQTGPLFGVDMDHAGRLLPRVAQPRILGAEVPQTADAQILHHATHGRQGSAHTHGLGDPPWGAALLAEVQRGLLSLRIDAEAWTT